MGIANTYDLVFEGGGAKGMVFVGAYDVFTQHGYRPGRVLGTSAGAITAAFVAAGYTAEEMGRAIADPIFATFMGPPAPPFTPQELDECQLRALLRAVNIHLLPDFIEDRLDGAIVTMLSKEEHAAHLFSFIERGGWYGAAGFISWLEQKLDEKRKGFSTMTLAQFFAATGVELSVVASDTTDAQLLVLNHNTAPECPLVWAVRMSMSIPFVWNEVRWQDTWGLYRNEKKAGNAIVDGGILSNFPLELFISTDDDVTQLMGQKSSSVIGMLIDESQEVPNAPPSKESEQPNPLAGLRTMQRIDRLIDTMMTAHDKMVIDDFKDLVVYLPAKGYGTTEFDMSKERREALVAAGRSAMDRYFAAKVGAAVLGEELPRSAEGAPYAQRSLERANHIAHSLLDKKRS